MNFLKVFSIALLVAITLFFGIGMNLDSDYRIERITQINGSQKNIFDQVNSFKNWEPWSPWSRSDSTMTLNYEGPSSGVGSKMNWNSEISASGSQIIFSSVDSSRIDIDLDYGKQGTAKAIFTFEPLEEGVKVTWIFHGDVGGDVLGRYLNLILDGIMGPFFEKGLQDLKTLIETPINVD